MAEKAKQMENEKLESLKDFETWKEWKNRPEDEPQETPTTSHPRSTSVRPLRI